MPFFSATDRFIYFIISSTDSILHLLLAAALPYHDHGHQQDLRAIRFVFWLLCRVDLRMVNSTGGRDVDSMT
jgi:hypothetical protein